MVWNHFWNHRQPLSLENVSDALNVCGISILETIPYIRALECLARQDPGLMEMVVGSFRTPGRQEPQDWSERGNPGGGPWTKQDSHQSRKVPEPLTPWRTRVVEDEPPVFIPRYPGAQLWEGRTLLRAPARRKQDWIRTLKEAEPVLNREGMGRKCAVGRGGAAKKTGGRAGSVGLGESAVRLT